MSGINRPWAIEKLQTFLKTASITFYSSPAGTAGFSHHKLDRPRAEVQAAAQVIEQILDRVLPRWRTADWPPQPKQPYWRHREATHRAISQLEAEQELIDNLGSAAPQLDAGTLHPWVWGSVQGLWSSGHYREAVGMAAKAVNAQTQAKLNRRDLSEGKLLSDAFTTNPPTPGRPRLRLMTDDGSETFKNRHSGAADLARGLYSAIRNPIAHEVDEELDETEALEQLAAFSILARWIDVATVATFE